MCEKIFLKVHKCISSWVQLRMPLLKPNLNSVGLYFKHGVKILICGKYVRDVSSTRNNEIVLYKDMNDST